MILFIWVWFSILLNSQCATATDQRVHFALHRRGGRLASHEPANLTKLAKLIEKTELRYERTQRVIQGNKLARKWKSKTSVLDADEELLQEPGRDSRWFFTLDIGTPSQSIEVDVDMLSSDFYFLLTTSGKGSKYDTFASSSHVPMDARVHSLCRHPSDIVHLNQNDPRGTAASVSLDFAMCSPSKSSSYTLLSSGAVLGLAPPHALMQRLTTQTLLKQLIDNGNLHHQLWSLTLLDADSGILTLGGTIAHEVEEARLRGEVELEQLGQEFITPVFVDGEVSNRMASFPDDIESQFRWVELHGAPGHWTPLLSGLWVNGAKILKNQPVLLDINCPVILAPPIAAQRFYDAICGSIRLPQPYQRFFAIPCLNKVNVAFEFAGWMFPAVKGETRADALHGPAGGPMSLGISGNGTGYCIGVVVERAGVDEGESELGQAWVLGEPFFRGLGVVFDGEGRKKRVGFRTY